MKHPLRLREAFNRVPINAFLSKTGQLFIPRDFRYVSFLQRDCASKNSTKRIPCLFFLWRPRISKYCFFFVHVGGKKKRKTKPVLRVKVNFRVDSLIRTDAHHRTALVKKEKKKECKLLCHCRKVVIGPIGCRGTQTRLERTLPAMRLNRGGGGRGGKGSTSLTLRTLPGAYRKMRHEMHALSRLRSFPAGSASVSTCRSIRFFARARVDSRR